MVNALIKNKSKINKSKTLSRLNLEEKICSFNSSLSIGKKQLAF
jgi:hypothetical protein